MENAKLRKCILDWVVLDDQIRQAGKAMKDIRKQKNELSEAILREFASRDITAANLPEGKLERKVSKRTTGIGKEFIQTTLKTFVETQLGLPEFLAKTPQEKAEELTKFIYDHRQTTETFVLKRTGVRRSTGETVSDSDSD